MSNNFNSISTLWMYLSLSVNIHQSYRFKMKLDISNWNFCPVQTRKNIQLDISNWRMSKNPKIPVQRERRFGYFAFFFLLGRYWNILSIWVNFFWTAASTVSVVSAALAVFDDIFCFAKSFSCSSNFSFLFVIKRAFNVSSFSRAKHFL